MKITKASLTVEADGKICAVILDGIDLNLMRWSLPD